MSAALSRAAAAAAPRPRGRTAIVPGVVWVVDAQPDTTEFLAGRVVEAHRHAETADNRATWTSSLAEYPREPTGDLRARYVRPGSRPTEDS